MNSVFFDSPLPDEKRREHLYAGQIFVFSPTPSSLALCEFARELCQEAFTPHEPRDAQHALPVEEYVAILARLKPNFIHHPESKRLIQGMLRELGHDPEATYFDVPRMRTATHGGYLTSGLAYAFHPHRDTWYSAPFCQINWWMPVYEIEPDNALAFHPRYWSEAIRNGSRDYNYYRWNRESRRQAAQHVKTDTRKQPRAEEAIALEPQLRLIAPAGGALMFSAAQLHSTVPNTSGRTRISIDFRTVNRHDVVAKRGAPNVDSACSGTALRDFLRASDLSRLPEAEVLAYDPTPPGDGELIFQPTGAGDELA
jgi:hypothetical protein